MNINCDIWETLREMKKCWQPAFSHFPTIFSKSIIKVVKNSGLCGKGLKLQNQSTMTASLSLAMQFPFSNFHSQSSIQTWSQPPRSHT